MTSIENREVKGVTTKFLAWLLSGVATVCITVVLGYSNIIAFMKENQVSNDLQQIQIDTLKIEQKTNQASMQALDIRLSRLEERISDLKPRQ